MKIKGTCRRDGREFMADQVVVGGGECPWDGEPFAPDYAVTLVNALRDAEEAGTRLEQALMQVADIHPEFTVHVESVVGEINIQLARVSQRLVRQG